MLRHSAIIVLAVLLLPAALNAQQATSQKASPMAEVTAKSLTWTAAAIPGFVPGMEMAVVNGDPGKEGTYTIRLRFPAGYAFPAHWHPQDENLTVLSGSFQLGMGDKTNASALKTYGPGDFLYMPATVPHYGRVEGVTIIQLHGTGPFSVTVVEQIPGAAK